MNMLRQRTNDDRAFVYGETPECFCLVQPRQHKNDVGMTTLRTFVAPPSQSRGLLKGRKENKV